MKITWQLALGSDKINILQCLPASAPDKLWAFWAPAKLWAFWAPAATLAAAGLLRHSAHWYLPAVNLQM